MIEFDVIIIGAGPVGLIAAQESLDFGKKVLLIDKDMGGNYPYLPFHDINTSQDELNKKLGGVGGTANLWHGQGLKLPKQFFEHLFFDSKTWSYPRYSELSKSIENKFGMKIKDDNSTNTFKSLHRIISRAEKIKLVTSQIPLKIPSWRNIFSSTLKNKKLVYIKDEVVFLKFEINEVTQIFLKSGKHIKFDKSTLVILAANSIGNVEILLKTEQNNSVNLPGIGHEIYDHPHIVALRYKASGNNKFYSNTFKYLPAKKIKLKKKFVVEHKDEQIGIFEIHQIYSKTISPSLVYKIYRKILRVFLFTTLKPEAIEVWIQIAQQSKVHVNQARRFFLDGLELKWNYEITDDDLNRFVFIAQKAHELLTTNGFVLEKNYLVEPDLCFETAAHPSGTVKVGYDLNSHSFNFEGMSNTYKNLMIGGGALIGNGSWVNPTLSIMTLTLGNMQTYFKQSS